MARVMVCRMTMAMVVCAVAVAMRVRRGGSPARDGKQQQQCGEQEQRKRSDPS